MQIRHKRRWRRGTWSRNSVVSFLEAVGGGRGGLNDRKRVRNRFRILLNWLGILEGPVIRRGQKVTNFWGKLVKRGFETRSPQSKNVSN